jgi:hypothetical protein
VGFGYIFRLAEVRSWRAKGEQRALQIGRLGGFIVSFAPGTLGKHVIAVLKKYISRTILRFGKHRRFQLLLQPRYNSESGSAGKSIRLLLLQSRKVRWLGSAGSELRRLASHSRKVNESGKEGKDKSESLWHDRYVRELGNAGKMPRVLYSQYKVAKVAGNSGKLWS